MPSKDMVALVLKPQRDGKDKFYPPSTKSPDNVSLMVHFLIDINVSGLHDCQHNREKLGHKKSKAQLGHKENKAQLEHKESQWQMDLKENRVKLGHKENKAGFGHTEKKVQ